MPSHNLLYQDVLLVECLEAIRTLPVHLYTQQISKVLAKIEDHLSLAIPVTVFNRFAKKYYSPFSRKKFNRISRVANVSIQEYPKQIKTYRPCRPQDVQPDVLKYICKVIHGKHRNNNKDLINFGLTCKNWCKAALKQLYYSPKFDSIEMLSNLSVSISYIDVKPRYVNYIQELHLPRVPESKNTILYRKHVESLAAGGNIVCLTAPSIKIDFLNRILFYCPNIERLSIDSIVLLDDEPDNSAEIQMLAQQCECLMDVRFEFIESPKLCYEDSFEGTDISQQLLNEEFTMSSSSNTQQQRNLGETLHYTNSGSIPNNGTSSSMNNSINNQPPPLPPSSSSSLTPTATSNNASSIPIPISSPSTSQSINVNSYSNKSSLSTSPPSGSAYQKNNSSNTQINSKYSMSTRKSFENSQVFMDRPASALSTYNNNQSTGHSSASHNPNRNSFNEYSSGSYEFPTSINNMTSLFERPSSSLSNISNNTTQSAVDLKRIVQMEDVILNGLGKKLEVLIKRNLSLSALNGISVHCPQLKRIRLIDPLDCLPSISRFENLQTIDITTSRKSHIKQFSHIFNSRTFTRLEHIRIEYEPLNHRQIQRLDQLLFHFSISAILSHCPRLKSLIHPIYPSTQDELLNLLKTMRSLPNLTALSLRDYVNDRLLSTISQKFPDLESLDISNTSYVTGYGIVDVVVNCIKLKHFGIYGIPICASDIQEIKRRLPKCEVICQYDPKWVWDENKFYLCERVIYKDDEWKKDDSYNSENDILGDDLLNTEKEKEEEEVNDTLDVLDEEIEIIEGIENIKNEEVIVVSENKSEKEENGKTINNIDHIEKDVEAIEGIDINNNEIKKIEVEEDKKKGREEREDMDIKDNKQIKTQLNKIENDILINNYELDNSINVNSKNDKKINKTNIIQNNHKMEYCEGEVLIDPLDISKENKIIENEKEINSNSKESTNSFDDDYLISEIHPLSTSDDVSFNNKESIEKDEEIFNTMENEIINMNMETSSTPESIIQINDNDISNTTTTTITMINNTNTNNQKLNSNNKFNIDIEEVEEEEEEEEDQEKTIMESKLIIQDTKKDEKIKSGENQTFEDPLFTPEE